LYWNKARYGNNLSKEMDLINNKHGRDAYKKVSKEKWLKPEYDDLSEYLLKRIKDGKLTRIVNGKHVPTDGSGRK